MKSPIQIDHPLLASCTIIDSQSQIAQPGEIILTFDDGPNPDDDVSERLLDVLHEQNVKATFCVVGANVERRPQTVRRAHLAGHELAIHTYNHRMGCLWSAKKLGGEIAATTQAIREAVQNPHFHPKYFRPPWGLVTRAVRTVTRNANLEIARITFYVRDAHADHRNGMPSIEAIKRLLIKHNGGAVVLHEMRYAHGKRPKCDKRWLPDAIGELIEWSRARGFQFTTYKKVHRPD